MNLKVKTNTPTDKNMQRKHFGLLSSYIFVHGNNQLTINKTGEEKIFYVDSVGLYMLFRNASSPVNFNVLQFDFPHNNVVIN